MRAGAFLAITTHGARGGAVEYVWALFADSLSPGTLVAGRYRIVRELGRGAMGAVYVVEHVNTGGQWALKVMLDTHLVAERAARFRREARASARISSEHVVRVTDADIAPELGGAPFLVMELLTGQDLERRLAQAGALAPSEVLEALTQVARGLEKAHAAGVVHRDLKPENVFLHRRDDGGVIYKVLDFGISKLLRPETDPGALSATGSSDVMGTPLYMAPEQAAAWHDRVGPATDVWALALMAYRMLTGAPYWQGQSVPEVFVEIMAQERVAPSVRSPSLPPAFDAWFAKSCAFHVVDRYQSVSEQIAALAPVLGGERISFRPSSSPSNPPRSPQLSQSPQLSTQVMARPATDPSSGKLQTVASTAAPLTHSAPPPATGRIKGIALVGLMVFVVSTVVGAVLLLRDEDGRSAHVDAGMAAAALVELPPADAALAVVVPAAPPMPVVITQDAAPARPAMSVAMSPPPPPAPPGSHRPTAKPAGSSSGPVPGAPPPGPGDLFDTQR